MALDGNGNLWVAAFDSAKIIMYTPAQRLTGGTASPAVALSGSGISSPNGLAFDNSYNLWVASWGLRTMVMEFTPAQTHTGGAQTPAVMAFRPHASFLPLH